MTSLETSVMLLILLLCSILTRPQNASILCGVMRVGLVAKGLLVKGDMDLELVLMCRDKPTKLLLYTVSANLPLQLQVRFYSNILHEQTNHNIFKLMGWHIIQLEF